MENIRKQLILLADGKLSRFNASLIPTVDKSTILGIATPKLRALARELIKQGRAFDFLSDLPHKYFEENQLHAFIVSYISDYSEAISELNRFLPYIDNWATCDQLIPKVFNKYPEQLLPSIKLWLADRHTYTVRFAIGMLMRHFLGSNFNTEYLDMVAVITTDEYYINMMSAWFFQTALFKHYNATLPYLTERRLSRFVHNKAISKSCDSLRIHSERKNYLRSLRII